MHPIGGNSDIFRPMKIDGKPDENNDWVNKREKVFDKFIVLGDKKKKTELQLFKNYSLGISTNRDAWSYNSSKAFISENIQLLISNYNRQLELGKNYIDAEKDPKLIKWSSRLENHFKKTRSNVGIYAR